MTRIEQICEILKERTYPEVCLISEKETTQTAKIILRAIGEHGCFVDTQDLASIKKGLVEVSRKALKENPQNRGFLTFISEKEVG